MLAFRFRAAAALDIRRKEEESAAVLMAQAEAEFAGATRQVALAEAALVRAQNDEAACAAAGADISTIIWHRNWIVGCRATVDRRRREADARRAAFRQAEAQWQRARARHLALERLRERAWRRFRYEEHREDIKAMDEIARLRHVLGRTGDTS
jgi:flagellar export protein FliJ